MLLDYKDIGTIGITCSTFDFLHAGHVVMLEEAKRHCDHLIAALQVDPTIDRPEKELPCSKYCRKTNTISRSKICR